MRVPWIRVHGALIDKPVVTRLMEACHLKAHHAIGVLVTFWSGVAAHATNGYIRDYSDAQLETWARWEGRRGKFAAWVRAEHMDSDGRVPEWDDYAGRLEQRRAQDRERKAGGIPTEPVRKPRGIPPEPERNSDGTPPEFHTHARERDETIRNGTKENTRRRRGPETTLATPAQPASAAAGGAGRDALLALLSNSRRAGMAACLTAWLDGMDLPPGLGVPTPEQLDQACREVVASVEPGLISTRVVRGYLARVMRPDRAPPPSAQSSGTFLEEVRRLREEAEREEAATATERAP